ncbi:VOC family protein [Afifella aestuarii]|uniref:VOC family protein n=1 Tax=Afifella aestuarii TaxID=1909496 RepID=UPI000FE35BA4|nr:VOC family protein [Afifella aestuarii]
MTHAFGRLVDHIHLRVSNVERSKRFYRAVFESLGNLDLFHDAGDHFYADELYFDAATDYVSRVHLAFQARSQDAVDRFYRDAIAAGGTGNGAPGWRDYHDRYYSAFVLDPDGNNIEALCEEPTERSAAAVFVSDGRG